MAVEDMISDPGAQLLLVLSEHVSRLIQTKIEVAQGRKRCEWILGWVGSMGSQRQELLVLRSDALTLLNLLWEDRNLFLAAFMSIYSPGLSGVLFLLWRYLYLERCAV
jgi:hypothetical protein